MKYRTKLLLAFVAIALISTTLGQAIIFFHMRKQLFQTIRSKTLSVAATAAAELNGEIFADLDRPDVFGTPRYCKAKRILQKIRDVNRRGDYFVAFVYTVGPSKTNPGELVFGVDSEEQDSMMSSPGEVNHADDTTILRENLDSAYVNSRISEDRLGLWLSAFAPIFDSNGNYVTSLGVDVDATDVRMLTTNLFIYGISSLGISILLAFFIAFWLSRTVSQSLTTLCGAVKEIGLGNLDCRVCLDTRDEFDDLALAINVMSDGLEERERLKANFARYVSSQVLEKILKSGTVAQLEGERRKITVLFSDIRDFTRLAEKMPPEQVVAILNEYFEKMIDVIFKNFGTLDKFLGDGIMVEFGTPLADPLQELHAIETAKGMQAALDALNEMWGKEHKPQIKIGIGINTGLAIVGNIGSEKRLEYTAIGDTVNVASRLEHATKTMQQTILLSEATYEAVKNQIPCTYLGEISIPGRNEPIRVYTTDLY